MKYSNVKKEDWDLLMEHMKPEREKLEAEAKLLYDALIRPVDEFLASVEMLKDELPYLKDSQSLRNSLSMGIECPLNLAAIITSNTPILPRKSAAQEAHLGRFVSSKYYGLSNDD